MSRKTPLSNEQRRRASIKIKHLMKDDEMPQEQAIATAISMAHAGKLDEDGDYHPSPRH